MSAPALHIQAKPVGEQLFRQQCAVCHGVRGEGTKRYHSPLIGSLAVPDLARFIAKSMPPGPHKCSVPVSQKVAAYIYDAFYSPIAQARNRPARVALSRLTVRQFRSAVADLVDSFRNGDQPGDQHGLRAEYYKSRKPRESAAVLKRIDPTVQFDFGQAAPAADQFDPYQFSARWTGAVLAPDTGEYEFVVRTDHTMRLWVNDPGRPLIDASIKSGNATEYRASITLLGGHFYPIQLEFSKATPGVDNAAGAKNKPAAKAFVTLAWKRPKQIVETIPQNCLTPVEVRETYVPSTPFPPDDRSIGYERGNSVSKAWDEATTEAALDAASYIEAHLRELSGIPDDAPDRSAKIQAFCRQFVERAFRKPLTADVESLYIARQFTVAPDVKMAVKRIVLLTLQSPRFLYREIGGGQSDAFDTASRLSFGLWDSLPDAELLRAAAAGELVTRDQVRHQAERMLGDRRSWYKLRDFLLLWLKVDDTPEIAKDTKKYPGFDSVAAADLRTSLDLFLENTAWSDRSDYREMMTTDKLFLNGKLAALYGAKLAPDAPFQPVSLDPTERSGVLTHPYLMSRFAYFDSSSPIHRGVLVTRNFLGRVLQPPPMAFIPVPADLHPDMTTRERVAMQTKPTFCAGCHSRINPLGFTLERFDAIGRIRDKENGKPIDSTGSYRSLAGQVTPFSGARDLGRYLADSEEAHAAFVEKLFQYVVKQPIRAYGPQALPELQRSFDSNGCSIRKLMVDIMAESALKR